MSLGDDGVLHVWRVVSMTFSERPVTVYVCDLHPGERLEVGPGQVHPAEC